jgi:Spindle and kinetochore-associated protein 1
MKTCAVRAPTAEFISLFSTTLQSLLEDAVAVRQVSSLNECLGDDQHETENRQELIDQLWHLHDLVTGLEDTVMALRQILSEEKRAIAKFEMNLKQEAEEQNGLVEQMLQAFKEHERQHRKVSITSSASSEDTLRDDSFDSNNLSQGSSSSRRPRVRRDSMDPRRAKQLMAATAGKDAENQDPISLPRITQEEFESYKAKNVRAPRISLMDLNEALGEIELLVQGHRDVAQALRRKQQNNGSTLNTSQRRHDFVEKRHHVGSEDSAIVSITEQDLRENCAFFRHGESTARSTLSLLCLLKRLKQLPAKNQQVVYHLLI